MGGPDQFLKLNFRSSTRSLDFARDDQIVVRPTKALISSPTLSKKIKILAVAFLLHLLDRHEAQSRGIEAIAHAGRLWTVVKNVAEVRVALFRADFRALHEESLISFLDDMRRVDRLGETRPAGAALEFVGGREERFAANQVDVNAGLVVVPVSIAGKAARCRFRG